MARNDILLNMLESSAQMQEHIAVILEAKALEAEHRRGWVCTHMQIHHHGGCEECGKNSLELHENVVDVIAGITRMELGLAKNLGVLIKQDSSGDGGGFGDLFSASGDDDA
jgi:hypothetical protein